MELADRFSGASALALSKLRHQRLPPGYVRTKPPFRLKLDAFNRIIDVILAADKELKKRHSAKRIFERLRDELPMPLWYFQPARIA